MKHISNICRTELCFKAGEDWWHAADCECLSADTHFTTVHSHSNQKNRHYLLDYCFEEHKNSYFASKHLDRVADAQPFDFGGQVYFWALMGDTSFSYPCHLLSHWNLISAFSPTTALSQPSDHLLHQLAWFGLYLTVLNCFANFQTYSLAVARGHHYSLNTSSGRTARIIF